MNTYLMHATGLWFAQNNTCFSIKAQFLESGGAVLPLGRHLAHTNFIANYFNWFVAFDFATGEFVHMMSIRIVWLVQDQRGRNKEKEETMAKREIG